MSDLNDCLELLLNLRDEEFQYEWCIRLFQFQTWIWCPGNKGIAARDAGRLAAAAILRRMEEEYKWQGLQRLGGSRRITLEKLQALSTSDHYRRIFNEFIASRGGWSRLLFTTTSDREFDKRVRGQMEDEAAQFVTDTVHYRLRAALNPDSFLQQKRSGTTHAIFFQWWRDRKAFTPRSAWSWWKKFHRTAVFIYLTNKRAFPMKPPRTSDEDFTRKLLHPLISKARLKKMVSEYQFVSDTLGDEEFYTLPARVRSASYNVDPFSTEELAIIKAYDSHSDEMSDPKKGLGTTLTGRAH